MSKFIPLSVPNLKGNELKYVSQAIETEWVSTAGPFISDFEKNIAEYTHAPGAVACQSGTAGLHLALQVCGVEAGEEVIVPTLTFIASVNPIKYMGADPIFMDCDDSLTMDMDKLVEFLRDECIFSAGALYNKTSQKRIRAIVIVHVFGNMADMERLIEIASQYNLKVIEDATEALGTYYISGKYAGMYAGTIGDIGVYSFNGNKIITTGGGGMIVSKDKGYLERVRYLSTQAKNDVLYFVHDEIGYNYRMTNIQAALGLAQLEQLEQFIKTKEENYKEYIKNGIGLLPFRENIRPNYWFYSYLSLERDKLIEHLSKENVQVRPIWKLIHTLKPYADCQTFKLEKSLEYYEKVVNLPCSTNLTLEEVGSVSHMIKEYEG